MAETDVSRSIVIAGSIAQKPWRGGHTWALLQYVLGFRQLGWDVVFLDRLEPEMCVDSAGRPCPAEQSANLQYFLAVMDRFELHGAYSLACDHGRRVIGLPRRELIRRTGSADMLLNIMGFLCDQEILEHARKRVFLDIDPGFGQMWQELGLSSIFSGHDEYVTIGENIGRPDCSIPTCGLKWITTRQPVVMDYWRPNGSARNAGFTTVASWRGSYGPIPFQGKTYGLRVHEFRRFVALPKLIGQTFEAALDIHSSDAADRAALAENGWRLVDPKVATSDPGKYQAYIAASGAEFSVAKNMYVDTRSGWFSDRSICYLASGKPVVVQDTGLDRLYPTGKGLLTYRSVEGAVACVEEVTRNYPSHAQAAREIAMNYFDSRKVLGGLLQRLSIQ